MKILFEPGTKINEDTSQKVTKTITETSIENDKALTNLNDTLLFIVNERAILASSLLSPLSKLKSREHNSRIKNVKCPDSNRVNDLLINKTLTVILYDNLFTFRDTDKKFEINEEFYKLITIENYILVLSKLTDIKNLIEFAKEMSSDEKALGKKSTSEISYKITSISCYQGRFSKKELFLKTKVSETTRIVIRTLMFYF